MRAIVLAAVLAVGPGIAFAGPSDHASRPFGDAARTERPKVEGGTRVRGAPYALTGERVQRRVLEYRDVPKGRGQIERLPFWTWVTE
jgi:hypothetical protein